MLLTRQYKIEYKGFNVIWVLMPAFRTENRGMKKQTNKQKKQDKERERIN